VAHGQRAELERAVQKLDREHADWAAPIIERELEVVAPVAYGNWKDTTPNLRARLRQIQRWRGGARTPPRPKLKLPFRYLWPLGESQRNVVDPAFAAPRRARRASHRIFLQNCSTETVREIHVRLGGREVGYEPTLGPGGFLELRWTNNPAIRATALEATENEALYFPLAVEFAVRNGRGRASLEGRLTMAASDGWTEFRAIDGQIREIE
jgi:hypothetical protein